MSYDKITTASPEAKALALGFGGTHRDPSPQIKTLAKSLIDFHKTSPQFREILSREEIDIEFLDDFGQSWDECNDFLHDFASFRWDVRAAKYQPSGAEPCHRLARYVYTDGDIERLTRRVELQLHIMRAKMDDILLNKLLGVLSSSNILTEDLNGQSHANPPSKPSISLEDFQENDSNMLDLYALVTELQNRLVKTLPHSQSQAQNNKWSPGLDHDEIKYLWRILKRRIPRYHLVPESHSPDIYELLDAKGLQNILEIRVTELQTQYRALRDKEPIVTTRSRASMEEEEEERRGSCNSLFLLPPPALPLPSMATPSVNPATEYAFALTVEV